MTDKSILFSYFCGKTKKKFLHEVVIKHSDFARMFLFATG